MMNTEAFEAQTLQPILCHLDKGYIQKDIWGGASGIVEETHPKKQATTKTNTMDTRKPD
jgi:hypothetical protein